MEAVKKVTVVAHNNDVVFKHWNESVFDHCYGHVEPPVVVATNETVTYTTWYSIIASQSRLNSNVFVCLQAAGGCFFVHFHCHHYNR